MSVDGMVLLNGRMEDLVTKALKEFITCEFIESIEMSCGQVKLYDGRQGQVTIRINTDEETWIL